MPFFQVFGFKIAAQMQEGALDGCQRSNILCTD